MGSRIVHAAIRFCRTSLLLSLAAGLALLAPGAARAEPSPPVYASDPVVMSGDAIGNGLVIPRSADLFVGGLSDTGQIVFSTGTFNQGQPEMLIQYSGGKFTPIAMPATVPASAGTGDVSWPNNLTIARPLSVNSHGDVVFAATRTDGSAPWGTFLWNAKTGHTVAVALKDTPATSNLTFTVPGGYAPAMNSSAEIALIGRVKDPTGKAGYGLFRYWRGGLEPVALPHQTLDPWVALGGDKINIDDFPMPSITDTGAIAFLAHPQGLSQTNAYLWKDSDVAPVLTVGAAGPGGSKITSIRGVFLNSKNADVLVAATTNLTGSSFGLYRAVNGQAYAVAAPGNGMPGKGRLKTVQYQLGYEGEGGYPATTVAVSEANSLGQRVFLATLEDGREGAYRIGADGSLTLAMQSSAPPTPVHITEVVRQMHFVPGSRPSINKRGQIALTARIAGGPAMVVLLTPD